jgi:hypothetical protein
MSEKTNENPVEQKDELSPIPAKAETGEVADATGAELDSVEGGASYVDPNFIGGRSFGGGYLGQTPC